VAHRVREEFRKEHPVHVTVRLLDGLPSLRTKGAFRVVRACIRDAHKAGFSVVEFSVMRNHVHLVIEASDREALSRGMQGLKVRITRRLNRGWGRRGTVFAERYHASVLSTPRQVRNALAYVLGNARRHAWEHGRHVLAPRWIDPYSSADTFGGWRERFARAGPLDETVRAPASWLLRKGWRRHGLLRVAEIPGAGARVRGRGR
jgi:REP element-mobilizing transposase RayT